MIDSNAILVAAGIAACAVLAAAAMGAVLSLVAMAAGLYAGVRIRQGLNLAPWTEFRGFLEQFTRTKESQAAAAKTNGEPKPRPPAQRVL